MSGLDDYYVAILGMLVILSVWLHHKTHCYRMRVAVHLDQMMITLDWILDLKTNIFSGTRVHPHCM